MKLKLASVFLIIWMVFLSLLLYLGRNSSQDSTDKSFARLLEYELAQHPGLQSKKELLEKKPQLQKINAMLDKVSRINNRMYDLVRSPAPIYCKEICLEQKKYRQEIQKLRQKIRLLLGQWEALHSELFLQTKYSNL